jgi:hypothetical protein
MRKEAKLLKWSIKCDSEGFTPISIFWYAIVGPENKQFKLEQEIKTLQ